MQTTGSLLRTSYRYHHDYGRLDDCHSSSSSLSLSHQQQHLNNDEIENGEQSIFLQHHHNGQQQQQQQQQQQHQHQQQPQFIQLTQGNFEGEQQQLAYEEQRTTHHDASSSINTGQQPVIVYGLEQSELETNYGQHLIEQTKATNTTNEEDTVFAISNYPIELYQQQAQPVDERSTIYYEQSTTLPSYANEIRPSNLDGNIPSQILQAHDQSIYCQSSIQALPSCNQQLQVDEPIDATASTCNLIEQHVNQVYSYHHYSSADGRQHHHQHNSMQSESEQAYVENCIPLELNHHNHHQHHRQQVYQNLDTIPAVQKEQPIVASDSSIITANQMLESSPSQVPDLSGIVEKSNLLDYNSCYTNQTHHSINQYKNNSNDDQDCLIRGIYDFGTDHGHESDSSAASSISYDSSEESSNSTLTRDERRAREANLPLSYHEIVNLSIDQFNEQLARHSLTELQLQLIKDIRRRGKNKVAAQSCRKRKMEQIYELQHEVSNLANRRVTLENECNQMIREYERLVQDYNKINAIVQHKLQQQQQQQQHNHHQQQHQHQQQQQSHQSACNDQTHTC